jgi:hypothetical protein
VGSCGLSFDADGNLVVTAIFPPGEIPANPASPPDAQTVADADAAVTAAKSAEAAAETVQTDIESHPQLSPSPGSGNAVQSAAAESAPGESLPETESSAGGQPESSPATPTG